MHTAVTHTIWMDWKLTYPTSLPTFYAWHCRWCLQTRFIMLSYVCIMLVCTIRFLVTSCTVDALLWIKFVLEVSPYCTYECHQNYTVSLIHDVVYIPNIGFLYKNYSVLWSIIYTCPVMYIKARWICKCYWVMFNKLVTNGTALEGTVRHFCAWNRKVMKPSRNQFKELSMTERYQK